MNKKIHLSLAVTATLIAMALTFSLTMVVSQNMFNNTVSSVKNKERMYNKLSEIDKYVRANEYFTIDDDTLNDMTASGYMLGISDKYAKYYSAKAYAEREGAASGKLMGIGVAVVKDASSGYARILRLYENSPATEVGMAVGGYITTIGDTPVKNLVDTAAITSALLGEEGTTVTVGYLSPDKQESSFEMTHTSYTVTTVSYQMLGDTCGYVRIDSFASGTANEFKRAVDDLRGQGAASFVFDVRDNTGENLNAALIAADYCVPEGLIAQSQSSAQVTENLRVSDENEITQPMVVLMNGTTAEGAELFANALGKMGGATLVGTTTAGKGVLLSDPQSLSDGSAVVITIGLLLDNEGASWNGTGLTPDVDAALSADEAAAYYDFTVDTDPQIAKALTAATAKQ
jgi:carboxyl-terminal processing protease